MEGALCLPRAQQPGLAPPRLHLPMSLLTPDSKPSAPRRAKHPAQLKGPRLDLLSQDARVSDARGSTLLPLPVSHRCHSGWGRAIPVPTRCRVGDTETSISAPRRSLNEAVSLMALS